MIGPTWATIAGSDGQRRLDNEDDYVRLEIASALKRKIAVIPVLVHEAHMPRADQLPENLKELAYRNSVEITHARWNSDVELLIKALGQYVHATKETESEPVHAAVPVQLPPLHAPAETAPVRTKSHTPLIAGLAVLGALAIAMAVFFALHSHATNPLEGRWTNPTPLDRNSLAQLEISGSGSQFAVHAWGLCKPANCDWGTQNASFDGKQAKATWNLTSDASGETKGRVATLTISAGDSGKLEVGVANTYTGHPGNVRQFEFVRAQ